MSLSLHLSVYLSGCGAAAHIPHTCPRHPACTPRRSRAGPPAAAPRAQPTPTPPRPPQGYRPAVAWRARRKRRRRQTQGLADRSARPRPVARPPAR
eukprot:scaffold105867_cov60-Phaeocystis_antarctica.AAC.3